MNLEKCRYMEAAYPTLTALDTCLDHAHTSQVFALALEMARAFQPTPTSDERIAWFLDDAHQIVRDFPKGTNDWDVAELNDAVDDVGDSLPVDAHFTVNGVEYVTPESLWEPTTPVRRDAWEKWFEEET